MDYETKLRYLEPYDISDLVEKMADTIAEFEKTISSLKMENAGLKAKVLVYESELALANQKLEILKSKRFWRKTF